MDDRELLLARRLIRKEESSSQVVFELTARAFRDVGQNVVLAFLLSVPITAVASILLASAVERQITVFVVAFPPAVLGVGVVLSQLFLSHENVHFSVLPRPEWLPRMRLALVLFSFSLAAFLTVSFIPTKSPLMRWDHPAIRITDALTIFLLGVLSPYLAKVADDLFFEGGRNLERIWKPLTLLVLFASFVSPFAVYPLISKQVSLWKIATHSTLSLISAMGVIYALYIAKPADGWNAITDSTVDTEEYPRLVRLRESGKITLFSATIGWTGLVLAMGTNPPETGVFGQRVSVHWWLLFLRGYYRVFEYSLKTALFVLIPVFLLTGLARRFWHKWG